MLSLKIFKLFTKENASSGDLSYPFESCKRCERSALFKRQWRQNHILGPDHLLHEALELAARIAKERQIAPRSAQERQEALKIAR